MKRRLVYFALCAAAGVAWTSAMEPLPIDRGAAGAWQKLQALRTTASALHITAHPDDEHGAMLAWLSRGLGVRTSMLTLNRGEGGDNAIGTELFDALGLVRTEELLAADRYYGVDRQYFTTVADYGFSKRPDEALDKWGHDALLADVVRVIRIDRPLVVLSRWQGTARDGHGQHQAAGLIAQEAFRAAGDPTRFPDQIAQGLRAWQPRKLYLGGFRENEEWTVRVSVGDYNPVIGDSYRRIAAAGLSHQRSQNNGFVNTASGPAYLYYKRVDAPAAGARASGPMAVAPASGPMAVAPASGPMAVAPAFRPGREETFFDGLDVAPPPRARAIVDEAVSAFRIADPSAIVPPLTRALAAIRESMAVVKDPDALFLLAVRERQSIAAINVALGVELSALAQPTGSREPGGFGALPTMGPVVPGQTFDVRAEVVNGSGVALEQLQLELEAPAGWRIDAAAAPAADGAPGADSAVARPFRAGATVRQFAVTVAPDAAPTRPYFSRRSIGESRYTVSPAATAAGGAMLLHAPREPAPLRIRARYLVHGVPVEIASAVQRREAVPPVGYVRRDLTVAPLIAVAATPSVAVVPLGGPASAIHVDVTLTANADREVAGDVALELPAGWRSEPTRHPFRLARVGEQASFAFMVTPGQVAARDYSVRAVASAGGRTFSTGYDVLRHRDLESRYLYREADVHVRGVDVRVVPGLRVGYVTGVGDQVPEGIRQLGATVTLLGERDLASGDLTGFDAIVTGTRAYGAREDLRRWNQRLLDYAKAGGNLIVLYNTPEFVPSRFAPFPGQLPGNAEEISEEDAPIEILAPQDPVFAAPNRIGPTDFEGWVEQRGSKFFSTWDPAYTPLVSSHDRDQPPQRGGWLHAPYGKGHYTYFAYALHRQLPYGVPGAYRILANLLSLGK